jgi:hypothetical protein
MANAFSIARSRFSNSSGDDIRAEIRSHTGCDNEASSILRSLERMGSDPSILRYEMTPAKTKRFSQRPMTVVWSVRAVRL